MSWIIDFQRSKSYEEIKEKKRIIPKMLWVKMFEQENAEMKITEMRGEI